VASPPTHASDGRAAVRRWRLDWQHAGRVLDEERWERLASLTLEERNRIVLDVLGLWRPEIPGDDGDALVRVQRALEKLRPPT
jgi:hypothetical protein